MQRHRPVKVSERPTVPMTSVMLQALQRLAERERVTRAELMRRLLEEGIERYEQRTEPGGRVAASA